MRHLVLSIMALCLTAPSLAGDRDFLSDEKKPQIAELTVSVAIGEFEGVTQVSVEDQKEHVVVNIDGHTHKLSKTLLEIIGCGSVSQSMVFEGDENEDSLAASLSDHTHRVCDTSSVQGTWILRIHDMKSKSRKAIFQAHGEPQELK